MTIRVTIINSDPVPTAAIDVTVEPLMYQVDQGVEQKGFPLIPSNHLAATVTTLKSGEAREFWVHSHQRLRVTELLTDDDVAKNTGKQA